MTRIRIARSPLSAEPGSVEVPRDGRRAQQTLQVRVALLRGGSQQSLDAIALDQVPQTRAGLGEEVVDELQPLLDPLEHERRPAALERDARITQAGPSGEHAS